MRWAQAANARREAKLAPFRSSTVKGETGSDVAVLNVENLQKMMANSDNLVEVPNHDA